MSLFETTVLAAAGVTEAGNLGTAVTTRANIFDMTQAAEDAVLRPRECGAFSHDLRAALASRIARFNADEDLATRYAASSGAMADLCDPTWDGGGEHGRLIAFVDKVAHATKDIAADDIAQLQKDGVSDADIVRLCELIAFMAYQIRIASGLRLMRGVEA